MPIRSRSRAILRGAAWVVTSLSALSCLTTTAVWIHGWSSGGFVDYAWFDGRVVGDPPDDGVWASIDASVTRDGKFVVEHLRVGRNSLTHIDEPDPLDWHDPSRAGFHGSLVKDEVVGPDYPKNFARVSSKAAHVGGFEIGRLATPRPPPGRYPIFIVSRWLSVPTWFFPLAFAVAPTATIVRIVRRRRLTPGCCRRCGYDLRATPGRCPECGAAAGAID